ncbi:unnamed protein product [Peniophora sp. CBMAI 1063]|nr:unnamed protein product [Peniophora sp. CBMAI 1063]
MLDHQSLWKYIPMYSRALCNAFLERSQPLSVVVYFSQDLYNDSKDCKLSVNDILNNFSRVEEYVHYGDRSSRIPSEDIAKILSPNASLRLLGLHNASIQPLSTPNGGLLNGVFSNLRTVIFTNSSFVPSGDTQRPELASNHSGGPFNAVTHVHLENCQLDPRNHILQLLLEKSRLRTLVICHGQLKSEQRRLSFPSSLQTVQLVDRFRCLTLAIPVLEGSLPSHTCLELHPIEMRRAQQRYEPHLHLPPNLNAASLPVPDRMGFMRVISEWLSHTITRSVNSMTLSSSSEFDRTILSFYDQDAPELPVPLRITLHHLLPVSTQGDTPLKPLPRSWCTVICRFLDLSKSVAWGRQLHTLKLDHSSSLVARIMRVLAADPELFPELRTLEFVCTDPHNLSEVSDATVASDGLAGNRRSLHMTDVTLELDVELDHHHPRRPQLYLFQPDASQSSLGLSDMDVDEGHLSALSDQFKETLKSLVYSALPPESLHGSDMAVRVSEGRISAMEDVLLSLRRYHNAHLPISTLPNEMLLAIFLLLVEDIWPRYPRNEFRQWIGITHVCHSWREMAIQDSRLWRDIDATVWSSTWIEQVMFPRSARAASFNLTVPLEDYPDEDIPWSLIRLALLPQNVARLRQLHLEINQDTSIDYLREQLPSQLPHLEDLSITMDDENKQQPIPGSWVKAFAPNLRKFRLGSCYLSWLPGEEARLPATITDMLLFNDDNYGYVGVAPTIPEEQLRVLLQDSTPCLEDLALQDAIPLTPGVPGREAYTASAITFFAREPTIRLPSTLKRFDYTAYYTLPGHLFSRLIIPPTTTVNFTSQDNYEPRGGRDPRSGHQPPKGLPILGKTPTCQGREGSFSRVLLDLYTTRSQTSLPR